MKLTVPMEPFAKGRHRTTKSGHIYTPTATLDAEALIRWVFISSRQRMYPPDVPLVMTVTFHRSKPKSVPKKREYPTTRPDTDNYLKLVKDALNKFAYADDSQIVSVIAHKRYSDNPRVEIEITEL